MLEAPGAVPPGAGQAVEWEEGGSTAVYRFEVGDGFGRGVERVSHKVLHGPTEGSFDGEGVLWLNLEEVGDHTVEGLPAGLTPKERLGAKVDSVETSFEVLEQFPARFSGAEGVALQGDLLGEGFDLGA
jgi:hypothetical protein